MSHDLNIKYISGINVFKAPLLEWPDTLWPIDQYRLSKIIDVSQSFGAFINRNETSWAAWSSSVNGNIDASVIVVTPSQLLNSLGDPNSFVRNNDNTANQLIAELILVQVMEYNIICCLA